MEAYSREVREEEEHASQASDECKASFTPRNKPPIVNEEPERMLRSPHSRRRILWTSRPGGEGKGGSHARWW